MKHVGLALVLGALTLSCATAQLAMPRLAEVDRVRETPAAKEAADLAPQAYAHAEAERAEARKAQKDGDQVAALLYADRAVAAYDHAFILARLARATKENDDAQAALATSAEATRQLATSRQEIDAEGEKLETSLAVVREAQPTLPSGPVDEKREMARLVAVRSLLAEARLLCGAARLVTGDASGADAEKEVADLDAQLDAKPHPAPIDAAARARARCLDRLTTARRAGTPGGASADALLAELSARGGLEPSRDERGVVIRLRDVFEGAAISKKSAPLVAELGRVAAAHPDVAVQVVVHDAAPPSKADAATDASRADAVVKALVAAGAAADHVKGEAVGARAPLVDPSDAAHRAMNARVEVVFVTR